MRYFYKMRPNPEDLFLVRNDVQIIMYFFFLFWNLHIFQLVYCVVSEVGFIGEKKN